MHDNGIAIVVPIQIGRKVVDRRSRDDQKVTTIDNHVGVRKVEQEAVGVIDHARKNPVLGISRVKQPKTRPVNHAAITRGALQLAFTGVPVTAAVPWNVVNVPVGVGYHVVTNCCVGDADAGGERVAEKPSSRARQQSLSCHCGQAVGVDNAIAARRRSSALVVSRGDGILHGHQSSKVAIILVVNSH